MPEVVISGDPQNMCCLFHGFWRNGVAEGEVGVQVTANAAAAKRTIADRSAALKVAAVVSPASTEKAAAVQTAAATSLTRKALLWKSLFG